MLTYFVPNHLGIGHITRDEAKDHNTAYTKDGTYFYCGKSSANTVNRSMYSGQEKRCLIKFMSLVSPTDYILDTIGPFRGTMNDASIAERILQTNNELVAWSDGSGQMMLDRGFRDVAVRIVSAALNVNRGPIVDNLNSNYHQRLAQLMRDRLLQQNTLLAQIEAGTLPLDKQN
ncbi:unnamed protein product [Adineta ricciae]|uniref:DDE Tnp4 domain-containing protein n=1 Tax=Adineta ricciae TaxID=249248 RepID=A0A814WJU3_ADIRI|nr:unnamed protein product [Adineta ricciae]CAF1428300.1 unnamed protein product [Adineta ricciae]